MAKSGNRAYLSHQHLVSTAAYAYIRNFIRERMTERDFNKHGDALMVFAGHILAAITTPKQVTRESMGVPIPCDILERAGGRNLRGKGLRELAAKAGIVFSTGYSKEDGQCREYFFSDIFMDGYTRAQLDGAGDEMLINVHTGKASKATVKSVYYGSNKKLFFKSSDSIPHQTMVAVSQSRNELNIERMREELYCMDGEARLSGHPADAIRYQRNACMYANIANQMRGRNYYNTPYSPAMSGRLFEIGGGAQGIAERLKYAAYGQGIAEGRFFNYDCQTCHPRFIRALGLGINTMRGILIRDGKPGLVDLQELSGRSQGKALMSVMEAIHYNMSGIIPPLIPCGKGTPMHSYCCTDKGKKAVHEELSMIGVPDDLCKQIPTSIFYGGTDYGMRKLGLTKEQVDIIKYDILPWAYDVSRLVNMMIYLAMRDCARNNTSGKYRNEFIFGIRERRMFDIVKSANHGVVIINKNGCEIIPMSCAGQWLTPPDSDQRYSPEKVTAHIIQGMESALWHRIALAQKREAFETMSLQHDGGVFNQSVPERVFISAIADIGLGAAHRVSKTKVGNDACMIVEKPFKRVVKSHPPKRLTVSGMTLRRESPPPESGKTGGGLLSLP